MNNIFRAKETIRVDLKPEKNLKANGQVEYGIRATVYANAAVVDIKAFIYDRNLNGFLRARARAEGYEMGVYTGAYTLASAVKDYEL